MSLVLKIFFRTELIAYLLEDAEYTYSYTTNGQLAQKVSRVNGDKTEYAWNVEGKVTQTTVRKLDNSIKSQIINKYDSFGRRIQKNDVRFVYDGESIIAEFGADNSVKALYLHGAGIDEPLAMVRDVDGDGEFTEKEVFFFSKDHLNSVHDLTDSQGKPVQRYNYTAYGKTKIEKTNLDRDAKLVNNPFAYTSREWEQESGDYYYRARYYDPGTGRFLSEDPIGFNGGDENLYRYVNGRPVISRDPDGLTRLTITDPPRDPVPVYPPDAEKEALKAFPFKSDRANRDAFRHCLASCYAATRYGAGIAEILGNGVEMLGNNTEEQHKQDYNNNQYGRNLSCPSATQFSCQNNCLEALSRGQLETRHY